MILQSAGGVFALIANVKIVTFGAAMPNATNLTSAHVTCHSGMQQRGLEEKEEKYQRY